MKKKYLAMILTASLVWMPVSAEADVLFTDGMDAGYEVFTAGDAELSEAEEIQSEEEGFDTEQAAEEELPVVWDEEAAAAFAGDFTYDLNKTKGTATVKSYAGSASDLMIPSTVSEGGISYSVTGIDSGAFKNHTELVTVSIPSTITWIGMNYNSAGAFEGCTRLKTVTMNGGQFKAYIGFNTFKGCSSLTSVNIPGNYTVLHGSAFANCISLKKMTLGKNFTGDAQSITHDVFSGCENLEEISLPTTLVSIGEGAFNGCKSLKEVVIPEGVKNVQSGAFKNCTSLTSASLPSTIETIGVNYNSAGAFEGCTRLATVTMKEGNVKAHIGYNTFKNCSSLSGIAIPGNYYMVYGSAFANCISLEKMTLGKNFTGDKQTIDHDVFSGCKNLKEISLPTTLERICGSAFNGCQSLKKAVLPEGVRFVESGAFKDCTALTSASLPSTIETIGVNYNSAGAFEGCTRLASVTMKEGNVKAHIGYNTFKNCSSLSGIVIPGNYYMVYGSAFANCISLEKMTLGKNFTGDKQTIDHDAFSGCKNLKEISLPTTLERIGENAFNGCQTLKKATLPEGVRYVGSGAFKDCTALTSVTLPSTIETIGLNYNSAGAFENCKLLTEVIIKEGTADAYMGYNTFRNCTSLRAVVIPGNYSALGNGVFGGCSSLLDLKLCESTYSFANQKLGADIVADCGKLINFQIPKTVGSIDNGACNRCTSLTIIGKTGSEAERFAKEKGIKFRTTPLPIENVTLAKPALVSAKQNTASYGVVFKWKAVANAKGYYVYRRTGTGSYKKIATVTGTSYADKTTKTVGTAYTYTVRAYGASGVKMSGYNTGLKVSIRPFTPKMKSLASTSAGMKVQWNAVSNANGYLVYRKEGSGSWKKIATVAKSKTAYVDKTAKKGKKYSYRVYSYKKVGTKNVNSAASAILTAKR